LDIEDWRNEIDALDERLVDLLNQRSTCCIEIGRIKRDRGLAVYSPDRETEVLDHVANRNGGPLESDAVRRLFERIIDESRRLERVTIEREAESGKAASSKAASSKAASGKAASSRAAAETEGDPAAGASRAKKIGKRRAN
jgi:chorismate mutase